jgi:phosphoglycolate phosphatase
MTRLVDHLRAVAFDLDGTLVDSVPDLAAAANAMLHALDRAPLPDAAIAAMVGDGVDRLVERALTAAGSATDAAAQGAARALFRAQYAGAVFDRSRVYPGVVEGLTALADRGLPLACVTNKASGFTLPLLDAAGLAPFFALTLCADRADQRKPQPYLLQAACAHFDAAPAALLYVGDGPADIGAARAAGCPVAAVDYGYGTLDPAAAADWTIGRLIDIVTLPAIAPPATARA